MTTTTKAAHTARPYDGCRCMKPACGICGTRFSMAMPDVLAALKLARECIAYCRRAHKDAQSGDGIPVEIIIDAAIAKAEARNG